MGHARASLAVLFIALLVGAMGMARAQADEETRPPVALIRLEGAIDVPSAEYLERALALAQEQDAQCLLILLNTPGGLADAMKEMYEALLNASVPTIVYVYPAGAYAISAGTFVTLSAHIAAMHPATTIGAAHPVQLFSTPTLPEPAEESPDRESDREEAGAGADEPEGPEREESRDARSQTVEDQKIENTFALQARVIAEARGRNADWAEEAVRHNAILSAREAVEIGVVDLLADDVADLLAAVDGREVSLPGKRTAVLATREAAVEEIRASAKERFLHVLADPNILLVLLSLAGLGILFELQNPGAILPGVIGGLCLLLSLYSMAVLPVNYAGVGLIAFGMLLLLAEVKVASHGVLSVGGVASFVTGALMLMDTPLESALRVSWQVILVMALLLVGFFLFVVGAAIRAHMRKVETGEQGMLKERGRALTALNPEGTVMVEGERWRARAAEGASEIEEGEEIEVVAQERFLLIVRRRNSGSTG
jgi:membrane-bound serine protease (ClpP class)